jgi:hypothetical protein
LRQALKWALALAVLAVLSGPVAANAAETPEKDPFYKAPQAGQEHENWREEAPGTVLKKRQINVFGYNAYQLLFRSNNSHGEPIVAVTTVGIPRNPWAGTGERPLVSYQEAIDSLGSQCNPSYTVQQGSDKEEGQEATALERGMFVNIPDHDGEDMEFVSGPNAGHVTLDSIRAAYNAKIGISTKNPLGLIGYSGGGETTAFAMEEQPTYAPELKIAVGAPGGIPVELKEVAEYNNGGPGFGLVLAAVLGISRGFPELELSSLLNKHGEETMKEIEKKCLTEYISNPNYGLKKLSEYTKPEYAEPLTLPKVVNVIHHDSLGTAPGQLNTGFPSYPTFIWESAADELIPVAGVDRLANYYCSEGVYVDYDRGATGEHIAYAVDQAPTALAFMESVFNGAPTAETCGVNASTNTKINSGPSGKIEQGSATFTYSSQPEVASIKFECRLDSSAFESCPSEGITYNRVASGPHSFEVRTVTPEGEHRDVSPATRSFSVTGADVGVTVAGSPNPVVAKKSLTYAISVHNAGPEEAAAEVRLTTTLGGGARVRGVSSTQGGCVRGKGKLNAVCSLGTLAPGATVTVTLVAKTFAPGTVSDTSSVASTTIDRNPSNNTATQSTTVRARQRATRSRRVSRR